MVQRYATQCYKIEEEIGENLQKKMKIKRVCEFCGKEVMTVRLAAEYLSIHPVTIYRYIRSGIIRAMHLPGKTLIKRADIDHLFETLGDIPERTHEFKEAKKPELTTVKETAQKYSISFPGAYKLLKEHKNPALLSEERHIIVLHMSHVSSTSEKESHILKSPNGTPPRKSAGSMI